MKHTISRREFMGQLARWGGCAVALGLASSCSAPWTAWRRPKTNVLIITLDTLRADHLSCYGCAYPTTPTLDWMASQGIRFAQAYSHCERTSPSHVSILSSLHPRTHGVLHSRMVLSPKVQTLQKMLRAYDYTSMAAVSVQHLGPEWGISEGFEAFYPCEEARRLGQNTVDLALNWLTTPRKQPFFAWVHLFDPHWIYNPLPPYDKLYYQGDPYDPNQHSMEEAHRSHGGVVTCWPGVTDLDYPIALYNGATTYVDDQVARILDALRQSGQGENTLIVVTSDHGEGFGEHGVYFDHFGIHEEQVRIPLIFYYPGYPWQGVVVDEMVAHVDIVPTILETLGIPLPEHLEGYSLLPAMRGQVGFRPQVVYLQMFAEHAVGLVTPKQKFIHYLKPSPHPPFLVDFDIDDVELYDLSVDRAEQVNLALDPDAETLETIEQYQQELIAWQESGATPYGQTQLELDEETEQMLQDLGY